MKTLLLKCPNCGASLEIENGLDTFFCKYCGYKIMLDEQSEASLKAKVRLKEMVHEETLKDKELSHERYKLELKEKQKAKEKKSSSISTIIILFFVGVFIISIVSYFSGEEKKHNELIDRLETTYAEIQVDISNGDYDAAMFKANTLYCDDNWSSETEAKWNSIRKSVIKTIQEAQEE